MSPPFRRLALAALLPLAIPGATNAQSPSPAATRTSTVRDSLRAGKRIVAVRVATPPDIDGRIDDAAWTNVPVTRDFTQKDPIEGAAPTDQLEVRLAYDDVALYVAARVTLGKPRVIQAPLGRRENIGQAEHIWVSFDTYRDERSAYSFGVSAAGVRADWYHPQDDEYNIDTSFEPVWQAASNITARGWTAEMRIPFSQLRFNDAAVQKWGVNIDYWTPSTNEDVFWIPVPKKETGWSSWMGELAGISGIHPSRRLELLPYVASEARVNATRDPANPFDDGRNVRPRIGGDLKMGIGPGLTLQATVNPDFGQVEADPAVVNLSAFETIFPERRPFFVEGSQLLMGGGANYFYSRRIGARPRGAANGTFTDYPPATTILGAAKVTGRLHSGTSVGLLTALTGQEEARIFDGATSAIADRVVAPRTGYLVGRLQQEFGANASTVGISLTGVERRFGDASYLRDRYSTRAYTGGGDFNYRFDRNTYNIQGFLGGSIVQGDTLAITALQRSSARYFQRPDARAYHLDRTRTTLAGLTSYLFASKNTGKHWLWNGSLGTESPGLELNDVGRVVTADGHVAQGTLRYRETQPSRLLRNYGVSLSQANEWNYDRDRQFGTIRADGDLTLPNFWTLNATAWHDFRALDERATRGGPLMGTGYYDVGIIQLASSFAAKTRWSGRVYYGKDEWGAPTNRISGSVSVRPSPQWQLTVEPNVLRNVATLPGGGAETYGSRYLFGRIDQSTFFADLRLNYVFKPDLTLELYAEPFAASGRYTEFGELAAARSRDLRAYGNAEIGLTRDPNGEYLFADNGRRDAAGQPTTGRFRADDFNVLSMRSNAVLRWEYRPGSTLFVVWQQNRADDARTGDLVSFDDVFRSFSPKGSNFFAVKANFWVAVL